MNKYLQSVLYLTGSSVVGCALFYIITSSGSAEFNDKLKENRGILNKDVAESKRVTQELMSKLRQGAGLDVKK